MSVFLTGDVDFKYHKTHLIQNQRKASADRTTYHALNKVSTMASSALIKTWHGTQHLFILVLKFVPGSAKIGNNRTGLNLSHKSKP